MPTPVNRTQLRQETHRSGFVGNISADEAVSVTLRRNGASDYRFAIDDKALVDESNETQVLLQTEFDQTQTAINSTTSAVNSNTTAVNAGTTASTNGTQKAQIVAANGSTNLAIDGSGAASVTGSVSVSGTATVQLTTAQYNAIIALLERVADATEAIQVNTTPVGP